VKLRLPEEEEVVGAVGVLPVKPRSECQLHYFKVSNASG